MGGFTPRFAFELIFLVLLAVACGLAELRPLVIGLVMGGAWLLTTAIEWLAWRSETSVDAPPDWSPEIGAESLDSWDMDEILAPLPEGEVESSTSVLPPGSAAGEEPEPGSR